VSELESRLFGNITLELLGTDSDVDAAIRDLALSTPVTEVTQNA